MLTGVGEPRAALELLARWMPGGTVIVTLGAGGAVVAIGAARYAHRGFTVDAVDTVGCGDAFVGAYLAAVAGAIAGGGVPIAASARVGEGAGVRGASVLCAGAVVEDRALVVDSVVLPGARVGRGAVVARSVVAPGAVVPDAALIVDDVFAGVGASAGAIGGVS